MTVEPRIRQAEANDVPALAALYQVNHDFQRRRMLDRLKPTSKQWMQDGLLSAIAELLGREDTTVLVADLNGEIVGLVDIFDKRVPETQGRPARRFAEVQNLVVAEKHRGHGVGSRLMTAAEGWARDRGLKEVQLDTWEFPEGPLSFYERRGYRTISRTLSRRL